MKIETMNEEKYLELQEELQNLERKLGHEFYGALADMCRDSENVETPATHEYYWLRMYRAACNAAGGVLEEYNLNLNELLGREVY